MNFQLLERVSQPTLSAGTGSLTLSGTVTRMFTFGAAGFVDGDVFLGLIEHQGAGEWEISICTYHSGDVISRDTVRKSSNANLAVDFSNGIKVVSVVEGQAPTVRRYREHTAAGPATMTIEDHELGINQTVAAAITVYLPASPVKGHRVRVSDTKGDSMTNVITVDGNGHNISGASTDTVQANYTSKKYRFNGTEWNIIR